MAGLLKPTNPCVCGGKKHRHLRDPERWVCGLCSFQLSERPSRKAAKGVCRDCGATPDQKPFKNGKNQCKECAKKTLVDWKRNNPEKVRANRAKPEVKARRHASVKRAIQRSPEAFLRALLSLKRRASNRELAINKMLNPVCLDIKIIHDDLVALWYAQDGKCAILGVPMIHMMNSLFTVSIDRIDSSLGYIPGNVQLTTQFANTAKRHYSNDQAKAVLDAYFEARVERDGFVHYLNAGPDHIPESY